MHEKVMVHLLKEFLPKIIIFPNQKRSLTIMDDEDLVNAWSAGNNVSMDNSYKNRRFAVC